MSIFLVLVCLLSSIANGFIIKNNQRLSLMKLLSTPFEPPKTFIDCVKQAAIGTKAALKDGSKLIEVEFPPLPLQVLEDSSSSARDIADANTNWAVKFAEYFTDKGKVSIIYPDQPELDDAIKYIGKSIIVTL